MVSNYQNKYKYAKKIGKKSKVLIIEHLQIKKMWTSHISKMIKGNANENLYVSVYEERYSVTSFIF